MFNKRGIAALASGRNVAIVIQPNLREHGAGERCSFGVCGKPSTIMNKSIIQTGCGVLLAAVATCSLIAAELQPRRAASQAFMRQKLGWSQATLEGLTLEKFDLVSKNAIQMRNMTHSNLWFTVRQPDYLRLTTNYQKSVDQLYLAAVDKKLDAATEAYVSVMRSCVDCHRVVRSDQRKNAGQPVQPNPAANATPVTPP